MEASELFNVTWPASVPQNKEISVMSCDLSPVTRAGCQSLRDIALTPPPLPVTSQY